MRSTTAYARGNCSRVTGWARPFGRGDRPTLSPRRHPAERRDAGTVPLDRRRGAPQQHLRRGKSRRARLLAKPRPVADPVDPATGDFTETNTDLFIPTYGPALDFTRTYDAQLAEQETAAGTPGAFGYGSTDSWASSLSVGGSAAGDIYTIAGLRTADGQGGSPTECAHGA